MALYVDEEEVWKCSKHPSKRRRTGICHVCLRERLSALCPNCANMRPCTCSATATTSTSSFSAVSGIGTVGRVSNLIENEPAFRRSRSLAVPFLRSKPSVDHDDYSLHKDSPKTASFWSRFKSGNRSKRDHASSEFLVNENNTNSGNDEEQRKSRAMMMRKSRSVAVTTSSDSGCVEVKSTKGKSWYFPSPIKAFRQSISRGIMVQERSPLYRG